MTTATAPWVDAAPFRAHLRHLMAIGDLTVAEVAALAGVSARLAESLLHGRCHRPVRRISPGSARALLGVRSEHARRLRTRSVPADESRLRAQRLLLSATVPELAAELGVTVETLRELTEGSATWCNALLALRLVVALRSGRTQPATAERVRHAA